MGPPRRRSRRRPVPHFCRLCNAEIVREPGKRGAPSAFCSTLPPGSAPDAKTCKELGEREYMRTYMRDYRDKGSRRAPVVAPVSDDVQAERFA